MRWVVHVGPVVTSARQSAVPRGRTSRDVAVQQFIKVCVDVIDWRFNHSALSLYIKHGEVSVGP